MLISPVQHVIDLFNYSMNEIIMSAVKNLYSNGVLLEKKYLLALQVLAVKSRIFPSVLIDVA